MIADSPTPSACPDHPRDLLLVFIGNTVIATILWLAGTPEDYVNLWLVSQCIGFGICFTHKGLFWFNNSSKPPTWQSALGTVLGAAVGVLAAYRFGFFPKIVAGNDWLWLVRIGAMALIIGAIVSVFFHNIGRLHEPKLAQRDAELRELSRQKEAATAHLRLLQAQIEPHSLFNTLANLHSLIGHDDTLARHLLERLNDYLRASLDHSRATNATLADECRLLAAYLDIQALRMGNRLRWTMDISPTLAQRPFPPMLLQPLVENAIRHGIEPRVGPGRVALSAAIEETRLRITVCDDGRGLEAAGANCGVGLTNVRERLAVIYGPNAELVLRDNQPTGVIAELWIPLDAPAP